MIKDKALLNTFNTTDLKGMAKKRGLKGYSKYKKAQLVDVLAAD
ncbi:MAG: Rho termination factor N-terminal domain-containing protein [Cyanobacteria bacterium P01_F01_bin.116]